MMISLLLMITIYLLCSHTINTTTTITTTNDTINNEYTNAIINDGHHDVHRSLEGQQYKVINGIRYMVKRVILSSSSSFYYVNHYVNHHVHHHINHYVIALC